MRSWAADAKALVVLRYRSCNCENSGEGSVAIADGASLAADELSFSETDDSWGIEDKWGI